MMDQMMVMMVLMMILTRYRLERNWVEADIWQSNFTSVYHCVHLNYLFVYTAFSSPHFLVAIITFGVYIFSPRFSETIRTCKVCTWGPCQ